MKTKIPDLDHYKDLIHQGAHYCFRRMPKGSTEFEDLVSEGQLVYFEFRRDFDPDRGAKFITGLWLRLRSCFAGILHKSYLDRNHAPANLDPLDYAPVYPDVHFLAPHGPHHGSQGVSRYHKPSDAINLGRRLKDGDAEWIFWAKPSEMAQEVAQAILDSNGDYNRQELFKRFGLEAEEGRAILLELAHCLSEGFAR